MKKYPLLEKVYSTEQFSKEGQAFIGQIESYLAHQYDANNAVNRWQNPEDELSFWRSYNYQGFGQFIQDILGHSMHLHNPKYMGHQVSVTAPMAVLTNMISDLLNNGGAVYEMGQASNAIEKLVTELFCQKIGYDKQYSGGLMTSGGTLANLTALLAARQSLASSDIWHNGMQQKLAVLVSSQAHYSIDRAARILGLGHSGVIQVEVDDNYCMNHEALLKHYNKAIKQGYEILAVIGSACSTATGSYDDLVKIGQFCHDHQLWFHVDGAHGGAAIFSDKHQSLLAGIDSADSVIIDTHKMMMTPALSTVLLFKDQRKSSQTFHQKAQYLFADAMIYDQWYNSGLRTFECTKRMMCLQFYVLWQQYGLEVFAQNVDCLYELGQVFARLIKDNEQCELLLEPQTNIVCFRYVDHTLTDEALNNLNCQIRQNILEHNNFYIVQTQLDGLVYLRVSIMNPLTNSGHFKSLLHYIEKLAQQCIKQQS